MAVMTILRARLRPGLLAMGAGLLMAASSSAIAAYRLQPGDSVEITIAGVPDLKQRSTVDVDGRISVPLVGEVDADGLTVSELIEFLRAEMPKRVYRQRFGGSETMVVIGPEEINASVVEYRPIYIKGDVGLPGEKAYRPGMTVRQAIALAGGIGAMRLQGQNALLQAADLKAEHEALWAVFAAEKSSVRRLEAELAGKDTITVEDIGPVSVEPAVLARIVEVEAQQMEARAKTHEAERVYLQSAIAQASKRQVALSQQQREEQEGVIADTEDLARVRGLFDKGVAPITRVTEARRQLLLWSTRALETTDELASVESRQIDLARELQKLDEARRVTLLEELQAANAKLEKTKAELDGMADRLAQAGISVAESRSGTAVTPRIMLYRRGANGSETSVVSQDAALSPGDVVELTLETGPAAELSPD